MFLGCFCTSARAKTNFTSKNQYYKEVTARLAPEEINILTLIYEDLASRNIQMRLTFENFLSFFELTGLWGAKLFQQFDEDKQEVISFEEFLYGISRTAKAPFQEKIKLLYCFFQDEEDEGIEFKNFTKMLYNYSREEIKDILIEDHVLTDASNSSRRMSDKTDYTQGSRDSKIIEVDAPLNGQQQSPQPPCNFDLAYQYLMDAHEEGTFYEINTDEITYKIKYGNMCTLIEQFATGVYLQHGIDMHKDKNARLSYESFSNWIKSHKKLFKSYYSAFHTDLWAYQDSSPSYLHFKYELEFSGRIECGELKQKVFGFQYGDAIIICQSRKKIKTPMKIICLEGLTIKQTENHGIQISHVSGCYKKVVLFFDNPKEIHEWMNSLKIYQKDTLHSNYFTGEVIGTGKFSIVYKCIEKNTNKVYALKAIDLEKLTPQGRKAITNQSETMKIINHPQIVKYKQTLHTKNFQYIITEYIYGQDLFQYVKSRSYLNQFESAFIIGNIIKAVMFLHNIGILHRDLKPENIMVMFKNKKEHQYFQCTTPSIRKGQRIENVKIIDFGLSNHMANLKKMQRRGLVVGTPNYIAPEVLLCQEPTFKSDTFAIGCILYFLLRGRLPFAQGNAEKTLKNTVRGDYDMEDEHWDRISYQAKDLLIKLLDVEPEHRIDLKDAINHEWFSVVHPVPRTSSNTVSVNSESGARDLPEQPVGKVSPFFQRNPSSQAIKYRSDSPIRKSK